MSINSQDSETSSQVEPILPRSAWNSQIAYLKVLFRAKKALERIEQEAANNKPEV
uniref:Uncharacterized protein n=1 Tax=Nostoc sp. PCC 9205 TaxID=2099383 RepID=A0A2P0ZGM7_9NOSO|nr:hypothetical protein [Nostoc sp. PCC 9205]